MYQIQEIKLIFENYTALIHVKRNDSGFELDPIGFEPLNGKIPDELLIQLLNGLKKQHGNLLQVKTTVDAPFISIKEIMAGTQMKELTVY